MELLVVLLLVMLTFDLARAQHTTTATVTTACATLTDEFNNISISWEGSQAVTPSEPACLDVNNTYLLRTCNNATWSHFNRTKCDHLASDRSCASGLMHIDQYCALVTLPQAFSAPCPAGFLKYYNYSRVDPNLAYWSPVHRAADVFTHIGTDSLYGLEFIAPGQRANCFVLSGGKEIPKHCDTSHHQLCITPRDKDSTAFTTYGNINLGAKLELLLKFDRKRGKILLNIYTPENILQKLDDPTHDAIYCFTNADDAELKSPVKIKRVVNKVRLRVYQIAVKYEHPGEYWCEAFDRRQNLVRSNTLIGYKKKRGHEYSLRLKLRGMCPESTCTVLTGSGIMQFLDEIKFAYNFHHVEVIIRVMKIFSKTEGTVDCILHLTTVRNTNVIGEYYMLQDFVRKIQDIDIVWFRSADYCLPETTQNNQDTKELKWKQTSILEETCPDKLCLNQNALPYKRKCLGSFIEGAYWEDFDRKCHSEASITSTTQELYNISMNGVLSAQNLLDIQEITTDPTQIIPLDVYLIANIMNGVEPMAESDVPTTEILDNVVGTIDHLMGADKLVLKESQLQLNATDALLDSVEKYFDDDASVSRLSILTRINAGETYLIVKPRFILHISKPFLSRIHGIGLYYNESGVFQEDMIVPIRMEQSFADLEQHNLELATFVPVELLEQIAAENNSQDNITLVITVFFNDHLFNSEVEDLGAPLGKIVSVKIPDFGYYLDEPLPILFRHDVGVEGAEGGRSCACAYWEYGEYAANKTGHWSNLGGSVADDNSSNTNNNNMTLTTCHFNHLTHFALLIMNQRVALPEPAVNITDEDFQDWQDRQDEYSFHERMFSLITLLGSILSLIGILGIFLTAIVFASWRHKTGSKILLQLSLAIVLEVIIVHVAGEEKLTSQTTLCNVVGICLHYVVLSKFSWMFVSAILQYLRFVKIFQVLPSRLILKAMIFAWGFPLIPVVLIATLLPEYNTAARKFCYPGDMALYLGLFLPVAVIVFSNCVVFILIMRNIFHPNVEMKPRCSHKSASGQNKLQIYLGILLFFMLGLPWVFGILGEILAYPYKLICAYLFCLMATLQGCVIFLFYVVFDRETRNLWLRAFQRRFTYNCSRSQVSSSK